MDDGEEDDAIGIPEWVVTFGDMMSLLLTFFIMLVSLSEIKDKETYQALVDSMQRQFGYAKTIEALSPGESRPRTAAFRTLATTGRAKKKDTADGGVPQKAPIGEEPLVRIVRPGSTTAVGGVVFFEIGSAEISEDGLEVLRRLADELRGKPQKIEIRGHVSAQFATRMAGTDQPIKLAFNRAALIRGLLIDRYDIEPRRLRIAAAADSEPMSRGGAVGNLSRNSRVEVFMLDETVEDLEGTADERKAAQIQSDPVPAERS